MSNNLKGRRALVTGSSTGIGLATATRLLESGAAVTINGRNEGKLSRTLSELRSRLSNDIPVTAVAGDVGTREGVDTILAAVGDVDILVHGAAIITRRAGWLDYTDEDWIAHFETNILGIVRICRPLLTGMIARGHGRIILISSDIGVTPAMLSPYSVSKTAQIGIARSLAMATKRTNVTVNSVLPGPTTGDVFTQMLEQHVAEGLAADIEEAGRRFVAEQRPDSLLGRPTTPEEVASLIVYLASDEAVGTNGTAVRVDGGSIRSIL